MLTVSQLIKELEKLPSDAKVLHETSLGTLVLSSHAGTVLVIPVNRRLKDGYEFRVRVNDKDEPDAPTYVGVVIH